LGPNRRTCCADIVRTVRCKPAALIFALAAKMVRINPDMAESVSIHESTKSLVCTELGIRYRALSADATTAYGLSPALIIHDELGQICPRKQIKPLQNMGFQTAA
jgi:phage terminase large subunit-like protein